jgi:hypothetical protein
MHKTFVACNARRQEEALDRAPSLAAQAGVWTQSADLGAIAASRRSRARSNTVRPGLARYQVSESMSTSWVQDGPVVLKKSDRNKHGIEFASDADAQRLQPASD